MKPSTLILQCYAKHAAGQWQAFCLNFDLAAQAESFDEAKAKLEAMIKEYVFDALVGEDKAFAPQFLNRKAPLKEWGKYYYYAVLLRFMHVKNEVYRLFSEAIPLSPYIGILRELYHGITLTGFETLSGLTRLT